MRSRRCKALRILLKLLLREVQLMANRRPLPLCLCLHLLLHLCLSLRLPMRQHHRHRLLRLCFCLPLCDAHLQLLHHHIVPQVCNPF
jgi:hypothetical protein